MLSIRFDRRFYGGRQGRELIMSYFFVKVVKAGKTVTTVIIMTNISLSVKFFRMSEF